MPHQGQFGRQMSSNSINLGLPRLPSFNLFEYFNGGILKNSICFNSRKFIILKRTSLNSKLKTEIFKFMARPFSWTISSNFIIWIYKFFLKINFLSFLNLTFFRFSHAPFVSKSFGTFQFFPRPRWPSLFVHRYQNAPIQAQLEGLLW